MGERNFHVSSTTAQGTNGQEIVREHRTTAVETLARPLHRPDGAIHKAPHTFAAHIDAEAFAIAVRRKIDKDQWDATDEEKPEPVTFGAYAARLAVQPARRRSGRSRPAPASTTSRSLMITCCPRSATGR